MTQRRLIVLALLLAGACLIVLAWLLLSGDPAALIQILRHPLGMILANRDALVAQAAAYPWSSALLFVLGYVALTGMTLPVNIPLSVAAGVMFGLVEGIALASLATAIGATLSCLSSRTLLRDFVRRRMSQRLAEIEAGLEREGVFFLLGLRLAPLVPYTVINLLFGLTEMNLLHFFAITWVGTLPATIAFVNAGTELQILDSPGALIGGRMIVSLMLLACLPIAAALARQVILRHRK